jgi:ABC-type cobalamin/Fe3+-siderophores transport system ATPase subunit
MSESIVKFNDVAFNYPQTNINIFKNLSLNLPKGILTCIGQNGTGKSTLLLLAAGLLKPVKGKVFLFDIDTKKFKNEHDRQKYVSFIYQNMEFETEDKIGDLLEYVYQNGFYEIKKSSFINELINIFELKNILDKKTQNISKGELQRTILAFSLLYGSKLIIMDEPIFAMEDKQKRKALDYINNFSKENNISIYYSIHDLELSKKYSQFTLLFYKNRPPVLGLTEDMLVKEKLEEAYETPYSFLKNNERIFRETMMKV